MHVGGGEPFLNLDGLIRVAGVIKDAGIALEYVETNAFWAKDDSAVNTLEKLTRAGIHTLCISIDPFHAEYVPYEQPLRLAQLCERMGMNYFLWRDEFLSVLTKLDRTKINARAEMEQAISRDYIQGAAEIYDITYGGRAVNIEMEYATRRPAGELADSRSCRRLMSGNHFHADLYNRFIPPGCTGFALPLEEAVDGITPGRYPVFETLYENGISGLLRYAEERGFYLIRTATRPARYASISAAGWWITRRLQNWTRSITRLR